MDQLQGSGFVMVPDWIVDSDLSCQALRVYLAIGLHVRRERTAFPGRKLLAKQARCSVRTVIRCIQELVDFGAITKTARFTVLGRQTSSLYFLPLVRGEGVTAVTLPGSPVSPLEVDGSEGDTSPSEMSPLDAGDFPLDENGTKVNGQSASKGNGTNGQAPLRRQILNAIIKICDWNPTTMTRAEWGRATQAAKQLEESGRRIAAEKGLGMEGFPGYVLGFQSDWEGYAPGFPISPSVVTAHWSEYCAGSLQPVKRRR